MHDAAWFRIDSDGYSRQQQTSGSNDSTRLLGFSAFTKVSRCLIIINSRKIESCLRLRYETHLIPWIKAITCVASSNHDGAVWTCAESACLKASRTVCARCQMTGSDSNRSSPADAHSASRTACAPRSSMSRSSVFRHYAFSNIKTQTDHVTVPG